jgi:hypothetical protein
MPKKPNPKAKTARRRAPRRGARNVAPEFSPNVNLEERPTTVELKKEHPLFHGKSLHDFFHFRLALGEKPATAIARLTELLRHRYKDLTNGTISRYVWTVPALPADWWLTQYQEHGIPCVAVRLPNGERWLGFNIFLYAAEIISDQGKSWRMEYVSLGPGAGILARPKKTIDVDDGFEPAKIPTFDNSNNPNAADEPESNQPSDAVPRDKPGPKPRKNWKQCIAFRLLRALEAGEGKPTNAELAEFCQGETGHLPSVEDVGRLVNKIRHLL